MRALVVGEAFLSTGFGTVTTAILRVLERVQDCELFWYGVNLSRVPDEVATLNGQAFVRCKMGADPLGYNGLQEVAENVNPDLALLLNDAGPCAIWGNRIRNAGCECPIIGYVPVDGRIVNWAPYENMGRYGVKLVSYTKYGAEEAGRGTGETNTRENIPWCYPGLDTSVFNASGREAAREGWNRAEGKNLLEPDDFVVCMTNRNAPRKMLHEAILALGDFAKNKGNVKVIIRAARFDWGGDYFPTLKAAGLKNVITLASDNPVSDGVSGEDLANVYRASDVFLSASLTEGFGYCEYEAAACGCALVLPNNTVRPELWPGQALMECEREIYSPAFANTVGGIVARDEIRSTMECLYENRGKLAWLKDDALVTARNRSLTWTWERLVGTLVREGMKGPDTTDATDIGKRVVEKAVAG